MLTYFSALDAYFRLPPSPTGFVYIEGGLVELAGSQSGLEYPGLPYADATGRSTAAALRFICSDSEIQNPYIVCKLRYHPEKHWFGARGGVYEALHEKKQYPLNRKNELILFEAPILAARYGFEPELGEFSLPDITSQLYQRDLLEFILTGKNPELGLEILRRTGFLKKYWPEIDELGNVDHSKDYHPEGDAWKHTLETFSHRKDTGLLLSLSLLLHDIGKADAVSSGGKRFDGHSEIGERSARAFLRRLGYGQSVQDDVGFLVRYHMLPGALPRFPYNAVESQLSHPLFPLLLELFRCDSLSTFQGPEAYYEACAYFKAWQKNSRNPWRNPDGSKRKQK